MIEAVKAEFKKTRATTRADIKPAKVREFLKKLKLNKVTTRALLSFYVRNALHERFAKRS